MAKTALLTGASAGTGKATAFYLAQNAYSVYRAAHIMEKLQDLKAYSIKTLAMDVHGFCTEITL